MNLYQKHRPQTWEEMIGGETQVTSLQRLLAKKDRPHVFLFTGPPGCGKTTAARIAAAELGAGDLSIKEFNSANTRGIDTARQIIEQTRYLPADGAAMVFIIDELHQTTRDYQNAMLKPLEDTPDHVYFFLCTTNPEKLISALKSRCTEVKFSPLGERDIVKLLRRVSKSEEMDVSGDIMLKIADVCEGSPRRALVMLEKIGTLETEDEQRKLIESGLAEIESAEAIELCCLLMQKEQGPLGGRWAALVDVVSRLAKEDYENVRQVVIGYMSKVLSSGWNATAMMALEAFTERDFFYDGKARLLVALAHILCPE